MKQIALMILGFLFLAVGTVGIFIPVLPTTPFVICAAGCFGAASPTLYNWLEDTSYFGEYIKNYRNKTGISKRAKIRGLVFLWLTLGISAIFFRETHILIILGTVGAIVSVHILTINSNNRHSE